MAGPMCVTVGSAQVHLDKLAACVTTVEGYALSREQWIAFIMAVVQAAIAAFGGGSSQAPAEQPAEQKPEQAEQPNQQHPNRPRPR